MMNTQDPNKGRSVLSIVLAAVMIVELAIAGFKYPGFLLAAPKEPGGQPVATADGGSQSQSSTAADGGSQGQTTPVSADTAGAYLTEDIPLRYTEKQIAQAQEERAAVSLEKADASFDGIRIDLHAWNLENAQDELIVKRLPELSEGEEGWVLQGWDVSLASGQHEFPTCVELTIPRAEGEVLAGVVRFNEETGCWEDLYTELSEDETYYTAYTEHFSNVALKKYRFDAKRYQLTEVAGGEPIVSLTNGVFVVLPKRDAANDMEYTVTVDWTLLWNHYRKIKVDDQKIEELASRLTALKEALPTQYDSAALTKDIASLLGLSDNLYTLAAEDGVLSLLGVTEAGMKRIGGMMVLLDAALTLIKIEEQARKDGSFSYKKLYEAGLDHWLDILSLIPGGIAAAVGGLEGALIGLLWFAGVQLFEGASFLIRLNDPSGKSVELKDLYQDYYYRAAFPNGIGGVDYGGGDGSRNVLSTYSYVKVKSPLLKDMLELDAYNKLRSTLAPKGLSWYPLSTQGIRQSNGETKLNLSIGWTWAIRALLESSENEPQDFADALDALFYDYARAFWWMSDAQQLAYVHDEQAYYGYTDKSAEERFLGLVKAEGKDRTALTDELTEQLKEASRPVLVSVLKTYQATLCKQLQDEIKTGLLPILNTRLIFHVKDPALEDNETFQKSIYCVDWRTIKENEAYLDSASVRANGLSYTDRSFITPMRFEGDPQPLFKPLLYCGDDEAGRQAFWSYDYNHYANDNPYFTPQARSDSDVVFSCTYYHYLMMGAPKSIVFYDVRGVSAKEYANQTGVKGRIELPEMTGQKQADVIVEIGDETRREYSGGDLAMVVPYWINPELPGDYSYRISSYFREATKQAFRAMPVRMDKNGNFEVTVSDAFTKTFERSDQLSGKLLQTTASVEFSFTLYGTFDQKTGTGSASLLGNVSLRAGDVSEWAVFEGKACRVCTYQALADYGLDYGNISGDEADLALFEALGRETPVIIFSSMDEQTPIKVSSGNTNAAYAEIWFVLVPAE